MLRRFAIGTALLGALLPHPAAAQDATHTLVSPNAESGGWFGFDVAGVPDVNGDGKGDFLIGAPGEASAAVSTSGRAYVVSGATGAVLRTLRSPNPDENGRFGSAVAGVPDTDGDGVDDLLIGAQAEDVGVPNNFNAGRAYLFSGATGTLLRTIVSPGLARTEYFGTTVAGVPDANGDGRGDLLIGADVGEGEGPQVDSGRVYLISGATGAALRTLVSPNTEPGDNFGIAVAGVPDADGDGRGDLLIGAESEASGASRAGRAYLFSGATGVLVRTFVTPNPVLVGHFGSAVAGVPDINGDGRGDFLIGADQETNGADNAGRAYVFSGANGTLLRTLVSPNAETNGRFGTSVAWVPDTNGDGRDDLLIGALENLGDSGGSGGAYLFSGATGAVLRTFTTPNPELGGVFGYTVAGVPDTNGDGRGDVLIGAFRENGGPFDAGRAYHFASQTSSVTLTGPEGWRLLTVPLTSTLSDLLAEAWTQGTLGGDASDGDPNVFAYVESVVGPRGLGFAGLTNLGTGERTGVGRAVYLFADDDLLTPGVQGGFPKTLAAVGHTRAGHPATFPVSFTPTGSLQEDGWNLLGTPWTLSLDWDAAGWTKTNVDNTIYVWDRAAAVYRTWNGTAGSLGDGIVGEFQGFWVKANAVSPALVAPAAARVATAPPTTPLGPSLGLRLAGTVGGTAVADEAFVAFVPGATDALDPFDAYELAPFTDTFAALYTEADALLDIEARAPLAGPAVFTLGAAAVLGGQAAGGAFTLSWPDLSAVPGSWRLTLTDLASSVSVDLRQQPSYGFTLASGLAPERVLSGSLMTPPVPTPLAFADAPNGRAAVARFLLRVEEATVATEGGTPAVLGLAVAPNPATGPVRLSVTLPAAADVRLTVVDVLGREVAVVAAGAWAAGPHDALLETGRLAPGAYVVRLQAGATAVVRRLTVVRSGR